ncbi:hypothetical protein BURK2_04283 [Burkholderiales bacterium]|nr:hypothetical protein BURK2_04283 [Burkholderiales bacterium]
MPVKYLFCAILGSCLTSAAVAAQRSFVSVTGSDANVGSGCAVTTPCRTFGTALSVTDAGGEILVLSSGGYEAVSVNKSIAIIAPPGVHAGIAVTTGNGISIDTPGANVVLRGLSILGLGGSNGIAMTAGSKLAVENCVVAGFRSAGVLVTAAAAVRIHNSLIRDQGAGGIRLSGGATADISRSKLLGNAYGGVVVETNSPGMVTRASISESMVVGIKDGADWGISAESYTATGTALVEVIRSTISNTTKGVVAYSTVGGSSVATLAKSQVNGNVTGMEQLGAGAIFRTPGNNTVRANEFNSSGTLTPLAPI